MGGGGERKEARARPWCGKNWAMDTKFNAITEKRFFVFVFCLFNSFLQVYRFKMSIS